MKCDPEISLIVPVYNTSIYLNKCLASLVGQTFTSFEIIVVNDGSTDDSLKVIERWQLQHPNIIKLLDKPNGGLSDARNAGLSLANGKYVMFVDSDDFLCVEALTTMHKQAEAYSADVCCCNLEVVDENGKQMQLLDCGGKVAEAINPRRSPEIIAELLPSACNKLILKSLFEGDATPFDRGIWYEDVASIPLILARANSITKVNKPLYKYVRREGSITSKYNVKVLDGIRAIANLEDKFVKANLIEYYKEGLIVIKLKMLSATTIRICQSFESKIVERDCRVVREYYLSMLAAEMNIDFSRLPKLQRFILWMLRWNQSNLLMKIYKFKGYLTNK